MNKWRRVRDECASVRETDTDCSVSGHARVILSLDNNKTVIGTGFAIQFSER